MPGLSNRTATGRIEDVLLTAVDLGLRERKFTVASIALLRAQVSVGASGTQSLAPDTLAVVTGTGLYRWSTSSSAADNGTTIIKPTDAGTTGRWLKQSNPGGTSTPLRLRGTDVTTITSGYLQHVDLFEGGYDEEEEHERNRLRRPAVYIDFIERTKKREGTNAGALSLCEFRFALWIIDFNARGDLVASRGSPVSSEASRSPGAYALAGDLENLLDGTTGEQFGETAITFAYTGTLQLVGKTLKGRGIIYALDLGVYATTGRTDDDAEDLAAIDVQPEITINRPPETNIDRDNVIVSGITVSVGMGLNKAPANGSAILDSATVTVSGAPLHSFVAWKDTYRDLVVDGTLTYSAVAIGADAPDQADGTLRIGRTRTDSTGVVEDMLLAPTLRDFGDSFPIP